MVELHIEQGRALDVPVGVASAIWPHGRWRFDFTGDGDHAGTTRMADRHDPMLTFAYTVLAANKEARLAGAHATMARVAVEPNATNAIPSLVRGWLDARAADPSTLDALVEAVVKRAADRAGQDGTQVTVEPESVSPEVAFDTALARRLARAARRRADPADRRRARRGGALRARADRDAVRPQPDRGVALPRRARDRRGLRRRRRRRWPPCSRTLT